MRQVIAFLCDIPADQISEVKRWADSRHTASCHVDVTPTENGDILLEYAYTNAVDDFAADSDISSALNPAWIKSYLISVVVPHNDLDKVFDGFPDYGFGEGDVDRFLVAGWQPGIQEFLVERGAKYPDMMNYKIGYAPFHFLKLQDANDFSVLIS